MSDTWSPDVQDVANILRARTVTKNGAELGNFTSDTRPTDDDVEGLIAQAYQDVQDAIGPLVTMPAPLINAASSLVALGAAMMVEISYFPEQVGTNRSPYAQLAAQYKDKLCRLQNAVVSLGGARPTDDYQTPAGAFGGPPIPIGMILPIW